MAVLELTYKPPISFVIAAFCLKKELNKLWFTLIFAGHAFLLPFYPETLQCCSSTWVFMIAANEMN